MIIEIKQPKNLKFYAAILNKTLYFKNTITNKYFCKYINTQIYFNLKSGKINNVDGYAFVSNDKKCFYLNGSEIDPIKFAIKTDHIICNICNDFCNQKCFSFENLHKQLFENNRRWFNDFIGTYSTLR